MKTPALLLVSALCILVGYSADNGTFKRIPLRRVRSEMPKPAPELQPNTNRYTFLELNGLALPGFAVMQLHRILDVPNNTNSNSNHIDLGTTIVVLTNATDTVTMFIDVSLAGLWEDVNGYLVHESEAGKERMPIKRVLINTIEFEPGSDGSKITSIAIDFGEPFNSGRLRINSLIP